MSRDSGFSRVTKTVNNFTNRGLILRTEKKKKIREVRLVVTFVHCQFPSKKCFFDTDRWTGLSVGSSP